MKRNEDFSKIRWYLGVETASTLRRSTMFHQKNNHLWLRLEFHLNLLKLLHASPTHHSICHKKTWKLFVQMDVLSSWIPTNHLFQSHAPFKHVLTNVECRSHYHAIPPKKQRCPFYTSCAKSRVAQLSKASIGGFDQLLPGFFHAQLPLHKELSPTTRVSPYQNAARVVKLHPMLRLMSIARMFGRHWDLQYLGKSNGK